MAVDSAARVTRENPTGRPPPGIRRTGGLARAGGSCFGGRRRDRAYAGVNGRPIGTARHAHPATEFDATAHLRGGGTRCGSPWEVVGRPHIEDQDQWWHRGIIRSVLVHATEPVGSRGRDRDRLLRAGDGWTRWRRTFGPAPGGRVHHRGARHRTALAQDAEFDRVNREDDRVSDFLGQARLSHGFGRTHLDRGDAFPVRADGTLDRPTAGLRTPGIGSASARSPSWTGPAPQRRAGPDPWRQPARLRSATGRTVRSRTCARTWSR